MTSSGGCVLREAHHLPFELYSPRSSLITFGCIWRCYPLTGHVRSKRLTSQRNQIWSNNHIWILRGKFGWSVEIFFPYKKRSPIRHVVSCQVLQMMTVAERIASPIIYGSLSWQPVPIGVRSEAFRALLCSALWMRGRLTGQSTFMVFKSLGLIVFNCCSWMLMARQILSSVYVHLTEFIFL